MMFLIAILSIGALIFVFLLSWIVYSNIRDKGKAWIIGTDQGINTMMQIFILVLTLLGGVFLHISAKNHAEELANEARLLARAEEVNDREIEFTYKKWFYSFEAVSSIDPRILKDYTLVVDAEKWDATHEMKDFKLAVIPMFRDMDDGKITDFISSDRLSVAFSSYQFPLIEVSNNNYQLKIPNIMARLAMKYDGIKGSDKILSISRHELVGFAVELSYWYSAKEMPKYLMEGYCNELIPHTMASNVDRYLHQFSERGWDDAVHEPRLSVVSAIVKLPGESNEQ